MQNITLVSEENLTETNSNTEKVDSKGGNESETANIQTPTTAESEQSVMTDENSQVGNDEADFEQLIKGKYKDAFAKKVQAIINKRFKQTKLAEGSVETTSPQSVDEKGEKPAIFKDEKGKEKCLLNRNSEVDSEGLTALLEAGIDRQTALKVLHIDEIMEESARYGAQLAAKSIADGLKLKAARPNESALGQTGFSARMGASNLTPERRRELAKKALMGEKIGF